ncbi:MAG TPA: hypothetical protein VFE54_02790 [Mucilaginibacter sp.]|nr:hypothetical protein [Mucilaginibacter sp.]
MKKLVAILLLSAHLINIGGYVLVYQYFIHKSDVEIVKQMYDNKVNSAKLLELKVPVNMPTIQDWTEYEHIEGQIQLNNAYYNYVRLKMTRDTMYLICLPNTVKASLVKANIIMAKNMSDVPLSKKGPTVPSAKKVNSAGYDNVYQLIDCTYTPLAKLVRVVSYSQFAGLSNPYIESPGKPPNFSC